jgi:hypothetical protein
LLAAAALVGCGGRTSLAVGTSERVPIDPALTRDSSVEHGVPDGGVEDATMDVSSADVGFDAGLPETGTEDAPLDSGHDAPRDAGSGTMTSVTFASGAEWPWFAGDLGGPKGASLGMAALVCVSPTAPANCPAGAVIYQTSGSSWSANTASIPDALWIWRGDVILDAVSDLLFAVFQRTFVLGSSPTGTIQIAADDSAEVLVNGSVVGTTGSVTSFGAAYASQSSLETLDLTAFLVPGPNTITVVGQNGPASFTAGECSPCTYSMNTAGVVFGGTLTSLE